MTGGYIVLKKDFSDLVMENLLAGSPFNYEGAYDYLLSVISTGKPIILSAELAVSAGDQSGTIYMYGILPATIAKDNVSLTVSFQNSLYDVSVSSSAKNNVTITSMGG